MSASEMSEIDYSLDANNSETQELLEFRELLDEEIRDADLNCPLDDAFLLRFLRGRKGDPVAAFKMVQSYYRLRQSEPCPNFLERLHPEELSRIFKSNIIMVLKNPDSLGRRIVLFKMSNWDTDQFSVDDILISSYMIMEEISTYEDTQKNGIVLVAEQGGLSYRQTSKIASQFTIKKLKTCIAFYHGVFPARIKGMHVIKNPYVFDLIYKLAKPFMSAKMKNRIHPHGSNVAGLFEHNMSREMLPESFGGTLFDSEAADKEFMRVMFGKVNYYKEMAKYGYRS